MEKLIDVVSEEFKTEMNVLDKNETRRERIWKECVEQGKVLVKMNHEAGLISLFETIRTQVSPKLKTLDSCRLNLRQMITNKLGNGA